MRSRRPSSAKNDPGRTFSSQSLPAADSRFLDSKIHGSIRAPECLEFPTTQPSLPDVPSTRRASSRRTRRRRYISRSGSKVDRDRYTGQDSPMTSLIDFATNGKKQEQWQ